MGHRQDCCFNSLFWAGFMVRL
ncbi:hypothetical protein FQN60_003674 [Etheostoma spectabile]|uniref:Uncharacterized protein n=1 Tax=Etheostoma spectabile TaxID=54343 RepID=A0A5J5CWL2_9PERO|nr:hypothetical protein FQN60_003674 [Etheostoma spectabile]